MAEGFAIIQFALTGLKALSVLMALLLLLAVVGWLKGADSIALPSLGIIVATPLLIIVMTLAIIAIVVAAIAVSAFVK